MQMQATFDGDGRPTGFYCEEIHGGNIPPEAVEISDEDYRAYVEQQGQWVRGSDGVRVAAPPYVPTLDEVVKWKTAVMERHYDQVAQTHGYDTRYTCAMRAGYPGPFQAEGQSFGTWMDTCNALGYQIIEECRAGTREIPTDEELIALLPLMVWPQ